MPIAASGVGRKSKSIAIEASASGVNYIVPEVAGKKIRIISIAMSAGAEVSFRLLSGENGRTIYGLTSLLEFGGFVLPESERGWGQTDEGEGLNLNLSAAVMVSGVVVYEEI